ncbi:MAG: hypothetical protein Q9167_001222 [Letrouitia subvulpina]
MNPDEASNTQIPQIEDYRPGYPQFSALISSHPAFHIYRRFLRIRARLLLLKQDELSVLESQLDQVDRDEEREIFLGNTRRDNNPERKALFMKIKVALSEYDQNLKVLAHEDPRREDVTNLQNWVDNTSNVIKEEIAYLFQTKDLMTMLSPKDYALTRLTLFSEKVLRKLYKLRRKPQCDVSRDPNITIFPIPLSQKLTRLLFAWVVIILLLAPIVIVNALTSTAHRLVIIVVASTILITAITYFTNAKAVEILLSGATTRGFRMSTTSSKDRHEIPPCCVAALMAHHSPGAPSLVCDTTQRNGHVNGPCQLLDKNSELGNGSQFRVFKQLVIGLDYEACYRAVPINSHGVAAIKIPRFVFSDQQRLDLSSSEVSRQVRHMIIEITALCHPRLRDHPNIVDLLGWGISNKSWQKVPFLALELAFNDLAGFVRQSPELPFSLRHQILLDIAFGLDAVHEVGLIHGDLKPGNVLIFRQTEGYIAKIADFGGGANLDGDGILEGLGTVGWRAPEFRRFQENGEGLDMSLLERLDSYSYGLTVWTLFLKDGHSAPCTENSRAEEVALSEIDALGDTLNAPFRSILRAALGSLLKEDPSSRPSRLENVLNDGSDIYRDSNSIETSKFDMFTGNSVDKYEWEIPEISVQTIPSLQLAFLRKEPLNVDIIEAMLLKSMGTGRQLHVENDTRQLLFDLLLAGAHLGSQHAKASLHCIYKYFGIQSSLEIRSLENTWVFESVAAGAFFLRKSLGHYNPSLLEAAVEKFHNSGGYDVFYASSSDGNRTPDLDRCHVSRENSYPSMTFSNDCGDEAFSATPLGFLDRSRFTDSAVFNKRNPYGETALYRACMAGNTSAVLSLLLLGADPTLAPVEGGPTCLHWLFHFKDCEVEKVAEELVRHGANIHAISEVIMPMPYYPFLLPIGSPLHWTVEMSAMEATRSLLRLRASVSLRDGRDPYRFDENVRKLNSLLRPDWIKCSEAYNDCLGFSVIDVAVKNRDHEILDMLLQNRSDFDPEDSDEEGFTAFHRLDAGEWEYTIQGSPVWCPLFGGSYDAQADSLHETVAVLVHRGFDINKLTTPREPLENDWGQAGQTPLMIAVAKRKPETVRSLLTAGADVSITNTESRTALHFFTEPDGDDAAQIEVLSLLLNANANVRARDRKGQTPFLRMVNIMRHKAPLEMLLNHGADVGERHTNPAEYGQTVLPFLLTCHFENAPKADISSASILTSSILPRLSQSDNPQFRTDILENADLDGGTSLHYAAYSGLIRCCKILLEAGVSVNGLMRREEWRGGEKVYAYYTPTDRAMRSKKDQPQTDIIEFSPQELEKRLIVFDDIIELLKKAGGLRAKEMMAKGFSPMQDRRETDRPDIPYDSGEE